MNIVSILELTRYSFIQAPSFMATTSITQHVSYLNDFEVQEQELLETLCTSNPDLRSKPLKTLVWNTEDPEEGELPKFRVQAEQTHFVTSSVAVAGEKALIITVEHNTSTVQHTYKFLTWGKIGWRDDFEASGLILNE